MLNRGMCLSIWGPESGSGEDAPAQFAVTPVYWAHANDLPANGRSVPNHVSGNSPSGNAMTLCSGQWNGSDVGCTFTDRFANGPAGVQSAIRLQLSANTGTCEFFNRAIPAGTWNYAFQAKTNTGGGTVTLSHGNSSTTLNTTSINESTFTACTGTLVSNGSTNVRFVIRNANAGALDVIADELQLYAPGESVPSFSTEVKTLYAGALLKTSSYFTKTGGALATTSVPAQIPLDTFPLNKSVSQGTLMAVVSTTDTAGTNRKVIGFGVGQGTFNLAVTTGLAYSKPAVALANSIYRLADKGYHVMAARFKSGEQSYFIDGVQVDTNTDSLSTINAAVLGFLGDQHTTTQNSFLAGASNFPGKLTQAVFWDTWLDDDQIIAATAVIRAAHRETGETDVVTQNYWIVEGDSISASTYQVLAFNSNGMPTYLGHNMAVIGATMTGQANSLTARQSRAVKCIQAAEAAGYNTILSVLIGANGIPTISQLQDYWGAIRIAGAKCVACTLLPKSDATFNTNRNALNLQIRAASSSYDALCDFAADPTMGPDSAGSDTNLYSDGTHPTTLGQQNLRDIMLATLSSVAV